MTLLLPCFYFLFASCLRQPVPHGLECVTAFSPCDLLFVPVVQLLWTFSLEQPAASHDQPKGANVCSARTHCKWSTIHPVKAKNTVVENAGVTDGCYCRSEHCIWASLGVCSLCKYKAVNWIETSLEKQERKNGLSWGNSPFSKQREIVTGHAKAAIFGFQPPKNWPRSLPWNKTGWRAVYEWP